MNKPPTPEDILTPRTGPEERDYLLKRADDHRQRAEMTEEAGARMVHIQLQQLYVARARHLTDMQQD